MDDTSAGLTRATLAAYGDEKYAGSLVSWAAAAFRDRPAVVFERETLSFAEVELSSNRLAHSLLGTGAQAGDRVAVLLANSPESVTAVFGVEKAGLAFVALNARHSISEHLAVIDDAQAWALIVGPGFDDVVAEVINRRGEERAPLVLSTAGVVPEGALDLRALLSAADGTPPKVRVLDDALVRIAYTSGTTGKPKGIAFTAEQARQRLNNQFLAMEYGLSVDDAMLFVGPLTHAAGIHVLPCLLRGARCIIHDRFDAPRVLNDIERHRVTQLMVVPTMLHRLVQLIEQGHPADLSSLRRIHYGTAPTPPALLDRAQRVFGPILRQQYGMTEAPQPLAVLYPHEHIWDAAGEQESPIASCGRPTANVRLALLDTEGSPVAAGEIGEIALAHEGIAKVSFWRRPELTADVVRDGWFFTGDLGRFDGNGYLHLVGRSKDLIISGGFNVYAGEVERVLQSHPDIDEAAVVGIPDPEWGEIVAALVVPRDGAELSAEVIVEHCGRTLASYKKPRRVVITDALPRNANGKVSLREVERWFQANVDER